jgi:hypothetical protein
MSLLAIWGKDLRSWLNPLILGKSAVFSFLICFEAISEQLIRLVSLCLCVCDSTVFNSI